MNNAPAAVLKDRYMTSGISSSIIVIAYIIELYLLSRIYRFFIYCNNYSFNSLAH